MKVKALIDDYNNPKMNEYIWYIIRIQDRNVIRIL